jgi:hypothetical protein
MVSNQHFREMALFLPEAIEAPHFERTSFRVNKKIFATLDEKTGIACLMLSLVDQSVFVAGLPDVIFPVPNKWGTQGATYVVLRKVKKSILADALKQAWLSKAPKRLLTK